MHLKSSAPTGLSISNLVACLLLVAFSWAQPAAVPAVIIPVENATTQTVPSASPPPPPPPPLQQTSSPSSSAPAPPTPLLNATAPLLPPASECTTEALDKYIEFNYDQFFLLTRLVDLYTLGPQEAQAPALNSSYARMTILAPSNDVQFLNKNNINIKELASQPLQSILLAPTIASHYVRGYFPADALPQSPVATLCGAVCGDVEFLPPQPANSATGAPPRPNAQVALVNSPGQVVNIVKPNVAMCPGQWVIHEVDGYLLTNVSDPVAAAGPALDISYALGGEFNTYNLVG